MNKITLLINKVKSIITRQPPKRKQTFPPNLGDVSWFDINNNIGLHGYRQKKFTEVRSGRERLLHIPYQPEIAKSHMNNQSLPINDNTGGKDKKDIEVLDEYDPGKIKW